MPSACQTASAPDCLTDWLERLIADTAFAIAKGVLPAERYVANTMPATPTDDTISDLLSNMVVDAGGHVGDICIRTNASGSRSVVATAPIAEGDKLLAVPRALILASSSYEELRVQLLLERRRSAMITLQPVGDESLAYLAARTRWSSWLRLLPPAHGLPMEWEEGLLASLGDALEASLRAERAELEQAFGRVDRSYVYYAGAALGAGEEVVVSYGCHDDAVLLACYGFVPPSNPHRRAPLALPLGEMPERRRRWLAEHQLISEHYLTADGPSWSLLAAARLREASEAEAGCLHAAVGWLDAALRLAEGEEGAAP
ncbi:hypothetical protein EMIHUDRAFT_195669 [Emiliania huxleyi CCMP1516]|uniref:SET domain-containing protein n=2 Tax=Emiliania huxleyi TaxID=2903 RepID=A0A0D3JHV9_EMIH1|nr:hypothetical protein EMIHUDRAFT_195669 [Emiliania huxleyi CCMP1516]EOD23094.1 hypothetical protein EMIHUDRAFT_195669 [Emiliania huxleyi CCMP1516]|eukprot:XP_005775523.1 hypothetical protein EMIHUDRAFT_195669 [Emiliania huxleyi CCMP1516]